MDPTAAVGKLVEGDVGGFSEAGIYEDRGRDEAFDSTGVE